MSRLRPQLRLLSSVSPLALLVCACITVQSPTIPALSGNGLEGQHLAMSLPLFPSGPVHTLEQDRGQVVLLDVWATYCEPCKEALPMAQDLAKEYASRGLRVYAISVDEDQRKIAPFLKAASVQLPVLLDPSARFVEQQLRTATLPSSVLIDRKGVVRQVHQGFAPEFLQQYQSEIEELLREKAE